MDDLLLNFTTSTDTSKLSAKKLAKLQGNKPKGYWRDRHAEKRAFYENSEQDQSSSNKSLFSRDSSSSKRPRTDNGHHDSLSTSKSSSSQSRRSDKEAQAAPPKDGIVSSLFTFNPSVPQSSSKNSNLETNLEVTNAPLQDQTFDVCDKLKHFLTTKLELTTPTKIQAKSIPGIKEARKNENDVVMVAQTGSGKTLGYLLPIYNALQEQNVNRTSGIMAVILAPTRELASQIYSVCEKISHVCHTIVPGLVSGGEKRKSEKARLRKGVNILIGTPGRMADHVESTRNLDFRDVQYVVLDEGDRLIDLGFEETLTKILAGIPQSRTTVLCSATMNASTNRLKTLTLTDPIIWVREESEEESAPGQLIQRACIVPAKLRLVCLGACLKTMKLRGKRSIVFFSCTDSVDFHHKILSANYPVFKLHGNMSQKERTQTLDAFIKSSESAVLLTTDVASRGLDIVVDEIIEYDPPFAIEDHMHRVGRTARAGKSGEATIFLLPSEEEYLTKLQAVHAGGVKQLTYQQMLQRGFGFSEWQDKATSWQLRIEKKVVKDEEDLHEMAKKAFTAHVRAYTTHPHSERHIFNFRGLHLGHLAKAFALREAPSAITGSAKAKPKKQKKSAKDLFMENAINSMSASEFNIM